MSYETIPIEMKDSGTTHVLTGIISDIKSDLSEASVELDDHGLIENIPIFYHCEENEEKIASKESGEELIPFVIDDKVIVVNYGDAEDLSASDMRIVGFEDGLPRKCSFYIDITVNSFTPAYRKRCRIVGNDGKVHFANSSEEEPWRVGPFSNVVWPAKIYLYYKGSKPTEDDVANILFSYYADNAPEEFIVVADKTNGDYTIEVNGVTLHAGEMQGFKWNKPLYKWDLLNVSRITDTTSFYRISNPQENTSVSFNESAVSRAIIDTYEGVIISLTASGVYQDVADPYIYHFIGREMHDSFGSRNCNYFDTYFCPIGLEPNKPDENNTIIQDFASQLASQVKYAIADQLSFPSVPTKAVNFEANRLGKLVTKMTNLPDYSAGISCSWRVETKDWEVDDIIFKSAYERYLYVMDYTLKYGLYYFEIPEDDCDVISESYTSSSGVYCHASYKPTFESCVLSKMGIWADSDGNNPCFNGAKVTVNYSATAKCAVPTDEGENIICQNAGIKYEAEKYEWRMLSTPADII